MIDDGKTSMEKSGQADSNVLSMNLPAEHRLKLDAAIRGELTLYPIRVLSETEYVNLAKVLTLASNVGIRRIYVSFNLPMGKTPVPHYQERLNIMWNLRGICAPLNARYSVVSSYPKRFLICVSFCKPITVLENTPLDGG